MRPIAHISCTTDQAFISTLHGSFCVFWDSDSSKVPEMQRLKDRFNSFFTHSLFTSVKTPVKIQHGLNYFVFFAPCLHSFFPLSHSYHYKHLSKTYCYRGKAINKISHAIYYAIQMPSMMATHIYIKQSKCESIELFHIIKIIYLLTAYIKPVRWNGLNFSS
jgi:hypothetical protein